MYFIKLQLSLSQFCGGPSIIRLKYAIKIIIVVAICIPNNNSLLYFPDHWVNRQQNKTKTKQSSSLFHLPSLLCFVRRPFFLPALPFAIGFVYFKSIIRYPLCVALRAMCSCGPEAPVPGPIPMAGLQANSWPR